MTAIALRNVCKYYRSYDREYDRLVEIITGRKRHRRVVALHPVSLDVPCGHVVGLIGKNGAGKSTLLKIISGTLMPSEGEVMTNGRVAALLELGSGFHPEMTGRDNVYVSAAVLGLAPQEIDRRYSDIVAFSELEDVMDRPVKTYSSGMSMRLAFSVATALDPEVLILDETLSVGDGAFARKSFERIIEHKQAGKTILFCSHSMYQVEAICDRVLWLEGGRLVMDGEPAQVVSAYSAYLNGTTAVDSAPASAPAVAAGVARLSEVQVAVDGVNGKVLVVQSGVSEVEVTVGFLSDPNLPAPSIALTILGASGHAVASVSTCNDGLEIDRDSAGRGRIRVAFPRFPLLKGTYSIDIFLFCEQGIHLYEWAQHVAELHVKQTGLEQGVVSLPRLWVPLPVQ